MTRVQIALLASVALLLSTAAGADTVVEDFENGNPEGWTWGNAADFIPADGGNPGAYLRNPNIDTFAPQPRTTPGIDSIYVGDYRAMGVTAIGIDLILHDVDSTSEGRPLTIMLINDGGTPGDFTDDTAAYFMGPDNVPLEGEGWKTYDFEVPAASETIPDGWQLLDLGGNKNPTTDWNGVVTDVTQLRFFFGDPTYFFIFQVWDVGMDNPRVTVQGPSDVAKITDVEVVFGSLVDGDIAQLIGSDDNYLQTLSRFGFSAFERNLTELIVGFMTDATAPVTFDLTVEAKLDHPNGTARIRFRNWSTNVFEQVAAYEIGFAEDSVLIGGIDAADRTDTEGRVELSIKHTMAATFTPIGFKSFFDQIELSVN